MLVEPANVSSVASADATVRADVRATRLPGSLTGEVARLAIEAPDVRSGEISAGTSGDVSASEEEPAR